MEKYWRLLKISWENGFVYRTSLVMWRLRQFLGTLMALTVWTVVFTGQSSTFGYSQETMITYVFTVSFLQSMVLSSALNGLAQQIYDGRISYELLKPVNIYLYLGAQELADKLKNVAFIVIETVALFLIFRPVLALPDPATLVVFLVWVIAGTVLYFLISLLFGSLGFWSPETWGPRFLFFMFLDFTAGKLFPLDILPQVIQRVLYLTPFPYLSFIQTQLFLGRLTGAEAVTSSLGLVVWLGLAAVLVKVVWHRGIKSYSAVGQ